jgi:hypothetical protein
LLSTLRHRKARLDWNLLRQFLLHRREFGADWRLVSFWLGTSLGAVAWCKTTMLQPVKCPVCGTSTVEPVLQNVKVTAQYELHEGDIGGLKVYRCTELGHIFFVRTADLEVESVQTLAS